MPPPSGTFLPRHRVRPGRRALPRLALVSPAARTMATADRCCRRDAALRRVAPADLYEADPEHILRHLRRLDDDLQSAMVVGHNPTAERWPGLLDQRTRTATSSGRGSPTCALGSTA